MPHNVTHAEIMQVTLQGRLIKLHFQLNYDNLICKQGSCVLILQNVISLGLLLRKLKTANYNKWSSTVGSWRR